MTCVVGLDVSQKTTAICVVDNAGRRGTLAARVTTSGMDNDYGPGNLCSYHAYVADRGGSVTRVWTDPLPSAEVERVAPNEDADFKARVTFGMEALAQSAEGDGAGLGAALADLPAFYGIWIDAERKKLPVSPSGVAKSASALSPRWRRRRVESRTASIF